ncbi:hypothetical protein ADUPG1_003909, partial [Aduncisulcus paluster]
IRTLVMCASSSSDEKLFLAKKGGLQADYSVSVVLDLSSSTLSSVNLAHTLSTIMYLLFALRELNISCVDVIVNCTAKVCLLVKGQRSNIALGQSSPVWPALISYYSFTDHLIDSDKYL